VTAQEIGIALAAAAVSGAVRRYLMPGGLPPWVTGSGLAIGAVATLATKGTTQAGALGVTAYLAAYGATDLTRVMLTTEGLGWSQRREHIRRAAEARRVN
jgi:hypothetical protein